MKKVISIVLLSLIITGCATKPPVPPADAPSVKESYFAAMSGQTDYVVHKGVNNSQSQSQYYQKDNKIDLPTLKGAMQNPNILARQAEDNQDFPMLPNPQVMLYIYPHFQDGLPIHGNWTTFAMYPSNHYALPSEINTGFNSSTYK